MEFGLKSMFFYISFSPLLRFLATELMIDKLVIVISLLSAGARYNRYAAYINKKPSYR